jgi:hypothetical protein
MVYYDCQDWTESGYSEATVIDRLNNMGDQLTEFTSIFNAHLHDTDHYKKADSDAKFWNFTAKVGDYDKLDGYEAQDILNLGLLLNGIYLWGGEFENIPEVFDLCNGFNSTPNLVGRQLVGAGNVYNVADTGGSDTVTPSGSLTVGDHTLTIAEMAAHYHTWVDSYNYSSATGTNDSYVKFNTLTRDMGYAGSGSAHGHSGSTFTGVAYEKSGSYIKLPFIKKTS